MSLHYRKYGKIIEITEIEKEPSKVRVYTPRERDDVYHPRRSDNIRKTRKICLWRVLTAIEKYGCPLLVTLTFAGDASDAAYANDALRTFQVRLRNKYPEAQSLLVPELSPHGRIHFHGLIFGVPLSLGDTRKGRRIVSYGDERKTRILAKLWGEGYVDARKTDGSPKLGYYISKYITKGAGQVLFNAMRILRISHGFPKQVEYSGEVAEELAREYADKKPVSKWDGRNPFLGKITKKTYHEEP
jgi:hypothetical protein